MAANRSTHALTGGKGMVFNRRGKETNARLDDSIFSSFFFFYLTPRPIYSRNSVSIPSFLFFFSFIMKKQILLGSWKQLREILDISLGHCRFTFVGTDYTERIFFTDFIQVLLNFFGNMRYFHDKAYYSLFWCNFISLFPLVELNISESTKVFCAQFIWKFNFL